MIAMERKEWNCRDLLRTQWNIYDTAILRKKVNGF